MTTMQREMAVPVRRQWRVWVAIVGIVVGLVVGVGIAASVGSDRASDDDAPASVQIDRAERDATRDERTRQLVNEGYLPEEMLGSSRDAATQRLQNQGLIPENVR